MREWRGRLLLIAGGILGALVLVELGLRALPAPVDPLTQSSAPLVAELRGLHERRPDRPWLYGLRPNVDFRSVQQPGIRYQINADGFRGRRYARPKPAGTFRIVVLGDSVAFGYGVQVEEAFPAELEALLAARAAPRPIEVVNLAVNGYNPYTEGALFEDVGVGYAPDLVLVQFCPNDLDNPTAAFNASTTFDVGDLPAEAFPDRSQHRTPSVARRVCAALRTCRVLAGALFGWQGELLSPADVVALLTVGDASPEELAWLRARYDAIAANAAHDGARFGVILFPPAREVRLGRAPFHERVAALAREAGWPTVDLLPAYLRATAQYRVRLFQPRDPWHPTALGHRVAADAIVSALVCQHLVPATPRPRDPPCG